MVAAIAGQVVGQILFSDLPIITRRHGPCFCAGTDEDSDLPCEPALRGACPPLMETNLLGSKIARIGARLKVTDQLAGPNRTSGVF
jgi:hypothetical protein